ncbi:hypothetical protein ACA910_014343 [Epithemia clementina (nom. ined.)]
MASNFGLCQQTTKWHYQQFPPNVPRLEHSTVVLEEKDEDREAVDTRNSFITVAIFGGSTVPVIVDITCGTETASLRDNGEKKSWRKGPEMNEARSNLGATRCGKYVYAAGGQNGSRIKLDTMERILVSDLKNCDGAKRWTAIGARLSEPRWACAAVSVKNRFVLVIGGHNSFVGTTTSIDIIDTKPPTNNRAVFPDNDPSENRHVAVVVTPGPNLQNGRRGHSAYVVGNDQIWVIGGTDGKDGLATYSIECLEFEFSVTSHDDANGDIPELSRSWTVAEDLHLSTARSRHASTNVGDRYLVVAGGQNRDYKCLKSVEVVDLLYRVVVTSLPDFSSIPHFGCSMICTIVNVIQSLLSSEEHP